ncbi:MULTISPECIES: H-NS histone family protein [unclassified Shimia]|uniref:H-NS histone family protein n=1 Tax=unclassified Shimia TaxID=2630038 RepID=UPI001ADB0E9D|nr:MULTISPECIES: H-NS histone family protein [unclassified Shimia]MBO9475645.1 H-NS histone family protein [Shimia sp. R10_1]MDA5558381.1 H-NS histone family protein [Shimia sp. MMG029]
MNLEEMSREALVDLRAQIDIQLEKREAKRKTDALKAVEEAAEKYGFSLEELANATGKKKNGFMKGVPKYAHPEDKTQTWTGKGRKPKWFDNALAAGISPEEMEV